MTPERERFEREVKKPRWSRVAASLCIALGIVFAGGAFYFAQHGSATSSEVKTQGDRRDCVTAYNADFTVALRQREGLVAEVVVAGINGDEETVHRLGSEIDRLNREIAQYPKLNDAVDHGYTLNGIHHPPCPG